MGSVGELWMWLAFILTFVGFKLLVAHWYQMHILITLGVVATALLVSILLSIYTAPYLKSLIKND